MFIGLGDDNSGRNLTHISQYDVVHPERNSKQYVCTQTPKRYRTLARAVRNGGVGGCAALVVVVVVYSSKDGGCPTVGVRKYFVQYPFPLDWTGTFESIFYVSCSLARFVGEYCRSADVFHSHSEPLPRSNTPIFSHFLILKKYGYDMQWNYARCSFAVTSLLGRRNFPPFFSILVHRTSFLCCSHRWPMATFQLPLAIYLLC